MSRPNTSVRSQSYGTWVRLRQLPSDVRYALRQNSHDLKPRHVAPPSSRPTSVPLSAFVKSLTAPYSPTYASEPWCRYTNALELSAMRPAMREATSASAGAIATDSAAKLRLEREREGNEDKEG